MPTTALDAITTWNDLAYASRDDNLKMNPLTYRPGWEGRHGTLAANFITAGFTGYRGHNFTSWARVRAGIFDVTSLVYDHAGFNDASGNSRIDTMRSCVSGTCSDITPSYPTGFSHPTAVLGILGGSIEQDQDPNYTISYEQQKRSGYAPDPRLYYYTAGTGTSQEMAQGTILVAQDAVAQGLDVLNMSWNIGCVCDRTCDFGGSNAAIRNATDAGVLFTVAAGNDGPSGCTTAWPALRRDVLTVGGLDSTTWGTGADYPIMGVWPGSSRGGMDLKVAGTVRHGAATVVDVVAPACYSNVYGPPPSLYPFTGCGTSFAAPTVAGIGAMAMNSFYSLGLTGMDTRMTQTYLMMLGDGYDADTGQILEGGMSSRTGAGRIKAHFMNSADLTAPWGFGCHKATISDGQVYAFSVGDSGAESTSITTWKVALTWKEEDLSNVADILLMVYNTCPHFRVGADLSYDMRKRVRLSQADIGGNCLEYDVVAYDVPSPREFTVCDYYQSGDPSEH